MAAHPSLLSCDLEAVLEAGAAVSEEEPRAAAELLRTFVVCAATGVLGRTAGVWVRAAAPGGWFGCSIGEHRAGAVGNGAVLQRVHAVYAWSRGHRSTHAIIQV